MSKIDILKGKELEYFKKEREEFLKQEGVREKVNDPRTKQATKAKLSKKEFAKQAKATKAWEESMKD